MVALFDAKKDAERLLELREKYAYCIAEREGLKVQIMEYQNSLNDVVQQLNAVTSMLSKQQLKRFLMWETMRRMNEIPYIGNKNQEKW